MTQSVKLVSVASAVPPYILEQRDVAAAAHRAFALRYTDFERLARVFKTSGIRRRYAVCPMEWYFPTAGLAGAEQRLSRRRLPTVCRCCE
jgi:alkylresorcinol/alkylpyrone synthase